MGKTLRPQNKCPECGYTWHPRGKNRSLKCPSCGHRGVKVVTGAAGAVIAFAGWAVFSSFTSPKTAPPPAASGHALPPTAVIAIAEPPAEVSDQALHQPEVSNTDPTDNNPDSQFPYEAEISEPRGQVVLQSGPSVFSSNLAKVSNGTHVHAASSSGRFIKIQLASGEIGYVRDKELIFH